MRKKVGFWMLMFGFVGIGFTSCGGGHEVCDAYTLNIKKEKIHLIKETASLNQKIVHN